MLEHEVLRALAAPGCPLCRLTQRSDEHYFFWFFTESYHTSSNLAALRASRGFCRAHASRLAHAEPARHSALAVVYQHLSAQLQGRLEQAARRGEALSLVPEGPCPACRSREESAERYAATFLRLLDEALDQGAYGQPALLCFSHLQRLAPRLGSERYRTFVEDHLEAVRAALRELPEAAGGEAEPTERQRAVLALSVRQDGSAGGYPPPGEPPAPQHDPVRALEAALARPEACPVCREVRRVYLAWAAWLAQAARQGKAIDDLLPTCPEHVLALSQTASAELALEVARHAGAAVRDQLAQSANLLSARDGTGWRWLLRALLGARLDGWAAGGLRASRAALTRPLPCPICHRLRLAERRTLELLLAQLAAPAPRESYARGYGLCVPHLAQALALSPDAPRRRLLLKGEVARLGVLHWELSESLRKQAWQYRPDARGAEMESWRRALLRFSGYLAETSMV